MSRGSGVPLERNAHRRYATEDVTAPDETVPLARAPVARRLSSAVNRARAAGEVDGPPIVASGELHALGLLHEVFHEIVERYEADRRPGAFRDALTAVATELGDDRTAALLETFGDGFPGTPGVRDERLEELLLTWLANENPAAEPLRELWDDRQLAAGGEYGPALATLGTFFEREPGFGPDGETLVELLRAPARHSPTSLAGQLRYVRDRWSTLIPALIDRLGVALDVIGEEERALHIRFGGGGGGGDGGFGGRVDLPSFGGLGDEPERFSSDSDWMPRLVLIAKSTYVWLDQLSRRHGREVRTLDAVPDEELDRLASWGVTGLWLIGLWERSSASERIKRLRGNPDAAASAYSLDDYRIADDLGGEGAFDQLKARAWSRGIRMATDMVPNHMGIDSRWVVEHPEWFLSLPEPPYPGYTFGGTDLSSDERVGIFLEDHYWDNSDAAVVFRRHDRWSGENRYVYHGNDGTSFPWNDTAQLDFLRAEVREQVIRTIVDVARRSPVIRFDAAMVLAKRHVRRLWYPEPGSGGAIPSRAEHGSMSAAEFDRLMPNEFWREVVDRVAVEVPDTLLLAEAFWMLEGYFVRTLGMHRVYNSAFMHMLRDENNEGYRKLIRETLEFDPEILKRYVNFMNNPDEKTAVEQFGKGDKYFGVATVMATMPGLPMVGHGQVEGFGEKYGMEFRRATLDEQPDHWLVERHEREIFPLLHRRGWFAGASDFRLYDFETDGGGVDPNVFVYSNGSGPSRSLVVYHNRFGSTSGRVGRSLPGRGQPPTDLASALGLGGSSEGALVAFRDAAGGLEFIRTAGELRHGLRLHLDAYARHVFWEFRDVPDATGVWRRIHDQLGGRGVASLEDSLRTLELEPVHVAVGMVVGAAAREEAEPVRRLVRTVAEATGTTGAAVDDVTEAIVARRRALLRLASEAEHRQEGEPEAPGPGTASAEPQRGAPDVSAAESDPVATVGSAFADPWHLGVLDTWAVVAPLGRLAGASAAAETSRAWFDELRLAPVVAGGLRHRGLDEARAWSAVDRVRSLLAVPSTPAEWLDAAATRAFLRVNRWQDEEWLDRDAWRELVDWSLLIGEVEATADTTLDDEARDQRLAQLRDRALELAPAAEAAGYRVDRLRSALTKTALDEPALKRPEVPKARDA